MWQPTAREPGPARWGPLSRKPPSGQEKTTPVFILILIHSTNQPLKNCQEFIFGVIQPSVPLVVNLAVAGSPTKFPWGRIGWNRWNSFGLICRGPEIDRLHGRVLLFNAFKDKSYVLREAFRQSLANWLSLPFVGTIPAFNPHSMVKTSNLNQKNLEASLITSSAQLPRRAEFV